MLIDNSFVRAEHSYMAEQLKKLYKPVVRAGGKASVERERHGLARLVLRKSWV